jgi:hypothetical protein
LTPPSTTRSLVFSVAVAVRIEHRAVDAPAGGGVDHHEEARAAEQARLRGRHERRVDQPPEMRMGRNTLRSPVVVALGKSMYQPMCFDGESSQRRATCRSTSLGRNVDTTRKVGADW